MNPLLPVAYVFDVNVEPLALSIRVDVPLSLFVRERSDQTSA